MSDYYEHDGPTPALDEVDQFEPEASCLDVDVKGPVRVHALPARTAVMHNLQVGDTPVQLAGRDPRRGRALIWPSSGPGDAVSAYASDSVDVNSNVGDALVTIPASSLPAGRYQIDAYTLLSEATTPDATNVLAISVGGTAVARLLSYNAVQSSSAYQPKQPFTLPGYQVDGSQDIAITVAVAETGTNVETFDAVLVATRLDAGAYYLGTREDEVQAGTAALIPAGGHPLEIRHCEPLWAKSADVDGEIILSFLLEQWAD